MILSDDLMIGAGRRINPKNNIVRVQLKDRQVLCSFPQLSNIHHKLLTMLSTSSVMEKTRQTCRFCRLWGGNNPQD